MKNHTYLSIHNSSYSNLHITYPVSFPYYKLPKPWWPVDWEWDYVPTEMCLEVPKMEYRMTGMKDE